MDAETVRQLLDTGRAVGAQPTTILDGIPHVLIPNDYKAESLEKFLTKPVRIKQTIRVFDPDSFSKYFTDYCNPNSRILVDIQKPIILGLIDYHVQGTEPTSEWVDHRLVYQFRETTEWQTWKNMNGKEMAQVTFASFLEDNLSDIISPPAAQMFEIAKTFEANRSVHFSSDVDLDNEQWKFKYDEEIRGVAQKGAMEVPRTFDLSLQPFEGAEHYKITARFRWRFGPDGLVLRYELVRPHKVIEDAVKTIVKAIEGAVSNPITYGALGA